MSSIVSSPQVLGAALSVVDSTALALLDVSGMTLGTQVYNLARGFPYTLVASSAALSVDVVAVANVSGVRWMNTSIVNGGSFGSDVSVPLANATPADVTAMRLLLTLLTVTPGSEKAQWLIRLINAGALADALQISATAIGFPNGVSNIPSLAFFADANTGFNSAGAGTWAWYAANVLGAYFGSPADFGLRLFMRYNQSRGGNVTSGTTITAPSNSNYFHVTGTTQIDFMTSTNWSDGALVFIVFDGALTVRHNTASPPANTAPFSLSGAANVAYGAGAKASFRYDQSGGPTGVWLEQTRLA